MPATIRLLLEGQEKADGRPVFHFEALPQLYLTNELEAQVVMRNFTIDFPRRFGFPKD